MVHTTFGGDNGNNEEGKSCLMLAFIALSYKLVATKLKSLVQFVKQDILEAIIT